jgi:hypothetical protein
MHPTCNGRQCISFRICCQAQYGTQQRRWKAAKLLIHHATAAQFAVGPETRTGWSACFVNHWDPNLEVLAMRLSFDAGNCSFNAFLDLSLHLSKRRWRTGTCPVSAHPTPPDSANTLLAAAERCTFFTLSGATPHSFCPHFHLYLMTLSIRS